MSSTRAVIGVVIGIVAAAALAAQSPQDLPTFKSDVQLIDVDVVVTGRDGKPVRGLTRDDFEIIENGQPQAISNFAEIMAAASNLVPPAAAAAPAPVAQGAAVPQDL